MNSSHRKWRPSINKIQTGKTGEYLSLQTLSVPQFKWFTPEWILANRPQEVIFDLDEADYAATCQLIHSSTMCCAAGALRGVADDSANFDIGSGTLPLVGSALPPNAITRAVRSADAARPINLHISN